MKTREINNTWNINITGECQKMQMPLHRMQKFYGNEVTAIYSHEGKMFLVYLLATVPFQVVRARMRRTTYVRAWRRTTYVRAWSHEYLHTEKSFLQYKLCSKSVFTKAVCWVQVWNLCEIICEVCLSQSLPHHKVSRQWLLVIGPLEAAPMVWEEVIFARFFCMFSFLWKFQ